MTLKNAAGTAVTLGAFTSSDGPGFTDANDAFITLSADVYEDFLLPGTTNTYGTRKKWNAGQVIQKSERALAYPTATVTSFSPSTGLSTSGGTTVTATGTNLRGVTAVTVGGTAATSVTVVNDQTVTFVTPAKSAATYTVVLTDDAGTLTKLTALTFA